MDKKSILLTQLFLVGLDILSLNIIFCTACYHFQYQFVKGLLFYYASFMFYLNIAWICTALLAGQYNEKNISFFEQFAKRSLQAYIYFLLVAMMYLFFSKQQVYISRLFTTVVLTGFALALVFNRFMYVWIYRHHKRNGTDHDKIVIVGYNDVSKKLATYLENDVVDKSIVGFCESSDNVKELSNYPILGEVDDAVAVCKKHEVAEIYSTIAPGQNPRIYRRLINYADFNCIRLKVIPDLNYFVSHFGQIDYVEDLPVFSLRHEPLEDAGNRIQKRVFDLIFSTAVILLILSWLLPLIALLIKLSSKGPVFFIQNRAGRNNKIFRIIKFRTLKHEKEQGFRQVSKDDNRVFKIGKFLRATNLDELPQFFNVFAGQMSVCGPRPHPLPLNDAYKAVVDKYMVRQFLKPGITGWAQVNGFRGETENKWKMSKRIEADLWYLENWSFWLDVRIIFLTVFNMIRGEENAF